MKGELTITLEPLYAGSYFIRMSWFAKYEVEPGRGRCSNFDSLTEALSWGAFQYEHQSIEGLSP